MPEHDTIVILDYGSQYSQLIARRVREASVFSVLLPWNSPAETVLAKRPKGFILSGGPKSVYDEGAPILPDYVLDAAVPILGICYGMQLLTRYFGGQVGASSRREYGPAILKIEDAENPIFSGWQRSSDHNRVWMSHGDKVERLGKGFRQLARTSNSPYSAIVNEQKRIFAVQFHPEVAHSTQGQLLLSNFVMGVCGCRPTWTAKNFIIEQTNLIKKRVRTKKVLLGLSGGVDSAVVGALIDRAVDTQLICIFVDHGLLRAGEAEQVITTFKEKLGLKIVAIHAVEEFMAALDGITNPEEKRKTIGELFIRIFEREAKKLGQFEFLAQGTIYPDVVESAGADQQQAHTIKTHHNVGGLPEEMDFELLEPLRQLFKDEVRNIGAELGLPQEILWRQPFPGPGLAIRCLGEVTWERLDKLRKADLIFREELDKAEMLRDETQQAFAVLLPVRSVGVMGDGRTYEEVIALRAVTTDDFMTADWARLPNDVLSQVSRRIINEVGGVNRVVYDITSKPPATIEWE